jgi:hypothetical protein
MELLTFNIKLEQEQMGICKKQLLNHMARKDKTLF